jgi:hypothetical protein
VPSVASALTGLPTGIDAELLALGQELTPLVAEINAARVIDRDRLRKFNAKLAALGLKEEGEYADASAYCKERWRLCEVVNKEPNWRGPRHRDSSVESELRRVALLVARWVVHK